MPSVCNITYNTIKMVLLYGYLVQIEDPGERSSGGLVHQEEHGPLAADQGQHVRQDPVDGVVDGALLLEDHPGQVQEDLVALDLESRHRNE